MTVVRIFKVDPEKTVEVPEALFSELLPVIDHLGELKITLYAIWYLGSQVKEPRFLRYKEMLKDERLMAGFGDSYGIQKMALSDALQRAVNRGTLLCVGNVGDEHDSIYFPNSAAGRAAFDGLAAGEWDPDQIESFPVKLQPERPNIYALYEQNIGPLRNLAGGGKELSAGMDRGRHPHRGGEECANLALHRCDPEIMERERPRWNR